MKRQILITLLLCFCIIYNARSNQIEASEDTLHTFQTINEEVVIATENYSFIGGRGGDYGTWYFQSSQSGYLGTGYMESSPNKPDDGSHLTFNPDLANLNYVINFKDTGTYYIHLRTYALDHTANGFFATINGKEISYGGPNPNDPSKVGFYIFVDFYKRWWWHTDGGGASTRGLKVSFFIPTTGQYTFTLYRRDAGSKVDHIWLTKEVSTAQKTSTLDLPDDGLFIVDKNVGTAVINKDTSGQNIKLYPNPASTELNVDCVQMYNSEAEVEIFSISGHSVYKGLSSREFPCVIDISSYKPGNYLVKVAGKGKAFVEKFIKK